MSHVDLYRTRLMLLLQLRLMFGAVSMITPAYIRAARASVGYLGNKGQACLLDFELFNQTHPYGAGIFWKY